MIRVVLADDQELVRVGFRMVLESADDIEVVGDAANGAEAVALAAELAPDVVCMDVRMPVMDGLEATRRIVAAASTKVLVLTTFDSDEYALTALRLGASGFLLKDSPPTELVAAVRSIAAGDAVVAPRMTRRLLDRMMPALEAQERALPQREQQLAGLTEREREVLVEIASGLTNTEIADKLVISETTVKTHVGRLLMKTGCRDRVQLVILAYETGLIG